MNKLNYAILNNSTVKNEFHFKIYLTWMVHTCIRLNIQIFFMAEWLTGRIIFWKRLYEWFEGYWFSPFFHARIFVMNYCSLTIFNAIGNSLSLQGSHWATKQSPLLIRKLFRQKTPRQNRISSNEKHWMDMNIIISWTERLAIGYWLLAIVYLTTVHFYY